ncbi:pyridoxamine 5'-phosphate oxidase family protein [Jannaschia sp. S6380]|uniref:pyridoxamine 5'-phosphate oxidase family protein n=1 Tax=Jannaschia sp. S6380 TaxID=2926408 RepID=UPI001FF1E42C|nr:pyridoxamine 5'-phosphate oxidase family protein [Jannaschia sp. S6380]MCK0169055.1 pyridoxamine 5'-phosphate oxidase family protein [Jannaschia sp. S6380]
MSDPFDDLGALRRHVWDRLDRGARVADDPFRFTTIATGGPDGPEARIVGLRRADRDTGEVEVHSDLRTAKVRALRHDRRAALLFWDAAAQLQLRLSVEMRIVAADPGRWSEVPKASRGNYGTDPAPGTPISAPDALGRTPDIGHFAALIGRVRQIDAVSLTHDPHRRAVFGDGTATWVAP